MSAPASIKAPKSLEQATKLLQRYASISGAAAALNARRDRAVARLSARIDAHLVPLTAELAGIAAALQPWWVENGRHYLPKGRKSMTLGGCTIGSKAGAGKLAHGYATEALALQALRGSRYARKTTTVTYSIDKKATAKLLELGGKTGAAIADLGFRVDKVEQFVLAPLEQGGAVGS